MSHRTLSTARSSSVAAAALAAAILALAPAAVAQDQTAPAPAEQTGGNGMFSSLGGKSDQPYEILADELQVFDAEKYAILTGDVSVRQEKSLLKAPYLKVFYSNAGEGEAGRGDSQGIRKLEARGGVYVESGTQVATGDEADYDAQTEIVELTGNVVLTDDGNVIQGEKLVINLRTGESKVTSSGRIKMLLKPGGGKN